MKNLAGLRTIKNIRDHYSFADDASLGEGSFGKVYIATDKAYKNKVALKVIPKAKLKGNAELPKLMKQELTILQTVRH